MYIIYSKNNINSIIIHKSFHKKNVVTYVQNVISYSIVTQSFKSIFLYFINIFFNSTH